MVDLGAGMTIAGMVLLGTAFREYSLGVLDRCFVVSQVASKQFIDFSIAQGCVF